MTIPDPVLSILAMIFGLALMFAAVVLTVVKHRHFHAALAALAGRVAALESRAVAGPPVVPTAAAPARPSAPIRRVDRPVSPVESGPILIAVPNMAATSAGPSPDDSTSSGLGRRFAAIWEMADAGTPAESIARATGQPIGQVELILGLKRRRTVTGGSRLT